MSAECKVSSRVPLAGRHEPAGSLSQGELLPRQSVRCACGRDEPTNPIHPDRMTRIERLDEVARRLALAILRRRTRLKKPSESSPGGLDSGRMNCPHL